MSNSLEAILLSDLHLSHKCPIARSDEKSWYDAMERPWKQVKKLAGNCPIVCGGDFFNDGWRPHNCPPELINWAIDVLPSSIFSVAGQHDLKHHRVETIKETAFWTLVKA